MARVKPIYCKKALVSEASAEEHSSGSQAAETGASSATSNQPAPVESSNV